MIYLKNDEQIGLMRKANQIVKNALELAEELVKPGITTEFLNERLHALIVKEGAYPSFLNYEGYPKSICTSIDEEVVHGIPSAKRFLEEGSIIRIMITFREDIDPVIRNIAIHNLREDHLRQY